MGCILSFFKFNNNKSYKVAESGGEDKSSHHGRKSSKKQQQQQQQYQPQLQEQKIQQQSVHNFEKPLGKNVLPLSNQSFIYKTVLEATVSDANANEEEERIKAAEAPGPFEIETDLLSPEVEEAVIKIQANVRGYLTRKLYRGVTPEPDRPVEKSQQPAPSQELIESSNEQPRSSSGILAPPPSFSDTPKEFPLDDNQTAANQGKKIAEKLIELERQVSQQEINEPSESTFDDEITSVKEENSDYGAEKDNFKQSPVDFVGTELKSQSETDQQNRGENEIIWSQRPLGIPSIETSEVTGPEEAAIKIQAAFRGYQVRKTISRETSPCQTREGGDSGHDVVHLRGKDGTSTQDPERESILVLNQLEECLSQELMKSSINIEDETSLSSYSTDIDLNASLKSNVSLTVSTVKSTHDNDDSDPKFVSIGSGDSSTSHITNQLEQTSTGDEQSIKIPETIKSESVNNEQIVGTSQFDSLLISTVNQVPLDVKTVDHQACTNASSKTEDQIVMIKTEPVLFVPVDEKVNAIDGSLKDDHSVDPVLIVPLNGKVDASQVTLSNDPPTEGVEEDSKSIKTIEMKPESTQLNADTKSQVAIDSMVGVNASTSATGLHQASEELKGPEIEPLSFDMAPPSIQSIDPASNQQLTTKDNPINLPQMPEQITSSIPDVHSSLPDSSDKQSGLDTVDSKSIIVIDASAQESQQKVTKLIKEDSFGSDILILDDEKNDSLYDPFNDDLTTPMISSNVQQSNVDAEQLTTAITFAENNLIQSVVDDSNKNEGLVLYETCSRSTMDSETISRVPEDNITEIKDDILVDLDESGDEDEDSQKRPIDESIDSEPKSPIVINIHRPSDTQDVELILKEKSKDLDVTRFEEQLTKQPESQDARKTNQSTDLPLVASTQDSEGKVQRTNNSEPDMQDSQSTETIDNIQQSTINHDKSTVEDVTRHSISTNPFLNQPDFDSDIQSGKIVLNNQSSKSSKDDEEVVFSSDPISIEQPEFDVEPAVNENRTRITGATDLETTKDEESKDPELSKKLVNEDPSSIASSTQAKSENLTALESSTPSFSDINQPSVTIEPIDVDTTEKNVASSETVNDGDPDEDETSNRPDSLLLRLQERETRSRSPNPFGRKKRRQKKNRGGAN